MYPYRNRCRKLETYRRHHVQQSLGNQVGKWIHPKNRPHLYDFSSAQFKPSRILFPSENHSYFHPCQTPFEYHQNICRGMDGLTRRKKKPNIWEGMKEQTIQCAEYSLMGKRFRNRMRHKLITKIRYKLKFLNWQKMRKKSPIMLQNAIEAESF